MGAVGTKKPLSIVKKAPVAATTPVSITKKSPTKTSSAVKTVTKTVLQSNNGVVTEETTTTQTVSGDPQLIEDLLKSELAAGHNGHMNGNGISENGAGDAIQMVLDSAAD